MKRYILVTAMLIFIISACDKSSSVDSSINPGNTDSGIGGSLARFAIHGNYLYTVDNNDLKIFNISSPENPLFVSSMHIGTGIETIFPRDTFLFIGTQIGMQIYSIANPSNPDLLSTYSHVYSCDPVVADSIYAYVTLHSENSRCGRTTNELQIIDISNTRYPSFLKSYSMTSPHGLGIDKKILFICDEGLKVYDASDVLNLKLKSHFVINAIDVIPNQNNLIVIGNDGLYQYKYQNDTIYPQSKLVFQ